MYEAKLISKADFPIIIKYNNNDKMVSPREQFNVEKIEYLPSNLPVELKLIRY